MWKFLGRVKSGLIRRFGLKTQWVRTLSTHAIAVFNPKPPSEAQFDASLNITAKLRCNFAGFFLMRALPFRGALAPRAPSRWNWWAKIEVYFSVDVFLNITAKVALLLLRNRSAQVAALPLLLSKGYSPLELPPPVGWFVSGGICFARFLLF